MTTWQISHTRKKGNVGMDHAIVSQQQWLEARREHLAKEKEFTQLRDQLSQQRRELPWVKVDKNYLFDDTSGEHSFTELFQDCSQLIIYHFMYGHDWEEGCPSCSYWADNYNGTVEHLRARDTNLVAVSKAPTALLEGYKKRMEWNFDWYSSLNSTFNSDFHVSFSEDDIASHNTNYNFKDDNCTMREAPGVSVFYKNDQGEIFHTYSCYARGLDMLNGTYHMLDLLPKGRDESNLPYPMSWVKRRDQY